MTIIPFQTIPPNPFNRLYTSPPTQPFDNLDLVYDELGAAYRVPAYLYSIPVNVIDPNARLPSATMVSPSIR